MTMSIPQKERSKRVSQQLVRHPSLRWVAKLKVPKRIPIVIRIRRAPSRILCKRPQLQGRAKQSTKQPDPPHTDFDLN
jgi:hypothetical protein